MLLDSLREHHLAGDMGRHDVYLYYTTPYVRSRPSFNS
jgi:acetoacetyl-CoA synthetase